MPSSRGVRQLPHAPGTAAPVPAALPSADSGTDGVAADQHPGFAVPSHRQRRDHRRWSRQGQHHHHRPAGRGDARRHRITGAVRGRCALRRLTDRDRLRPRPAFSHVRTRRHLLRTRDCPVRRLDVADPKHQRRAPDRVSGADDGHRAGRRADHERRRHSHGNSPGGRTDLAATGQRPGAGGSELLDHDAPAAVVSQHAEPDRRHQPSAARPTVRSAGGPRVHPGRLRAGQVRPGEHRAVQDRTGSG